MSHYFIPRMKKTLITLLLAWMALAVQAQESSSAYGVLKLPVSAHLAALGGENISSIDDDPAVAVHNPALLSNVTDKTLGLSFMTYADQSRWMGAQFVRAFGERHTGAVFAQYMGYGEMTERDTEGNTLGTFSPKDIVFGVGYSYLLSDHWSGGATFKVAYSSIANYSAAALVVDLGLNYYDEETDASFSVVGRNLGAQIKSYDGRTETVPYSFQVGYSKGLDHMPWRLNLTLIDLTRWSKNHYFVADDKTMGFGRLALNHVVFGADWLASDVLTLSAGYNFRRAYELKAAGGSHWAGFSAGASLALSKIKLNLSWSQYHKSTASLMGSVAYHF